MSRLDLSNLTWQEQLAAIYIGYYDRAADPVGRDFWESVLKKTSFDLEDVATDFATQPETLTAYPFLQTPTVEQAEGFIGEVYLNLFNRAPEQAGLDFWGTALVGAINGTNDLSVGEIILAIIEGAQGDDRTTILNKISVAQAWTNAAEKAGISYTSDAAAQQSAKSIIEPVTSDDETVDTAINVIDDFFAFSYTLTVNSPSVTEGDIGTKDMTFVLELDSAPTEAVTVNYKTTAGDIVVAAGAIIFAAGQTTASLTVKVNSDDVVDGDDAVEVVFSGGALTGSVTANGTVFDDDTAFVFTSSAAPSVAEGDKTVVTLTGFDTDGAASSVAITGGADAQAFTLVGTSLEFKAAPDFEAQSDADGNNVYEVTITATDEGGNTTQQAIEVTVTDENDETPIITSGATGVVDENADESTVVYSVASTDADAGDTVTYSLSGEDADAVSISDEGEVTLNESADFETKSNYSFEVTASDADGNTSTQAVEVSVTDVNETPVATPDTGVVIIGNTVTIDAVANDTDDDGDALAISGTPTADFGTVAVVDNQLVYTADKDFQGIATISFNVTDGELVVPSTAVVSVGQPLVTAAAASVDEGGTVVFNIKGAPETAYSVVLNSTDIAEIEDQTVTVTTDADGDASISLETIADRTTEVDGSVTAYITGTQAAPVGVTVSDTSLDNTAPVAEDADAIIAEGAVASGQLVATDVDSEDNGAHTFTTEDVVAGFTLNADGSWSFDAGDAAYESLAVGETTVQTITYTVSDNATDSTPGALTDTGVLTVTVTGTNDAPVISVSGGNALTVEENTTSVTTFDLSDVDNGAEFSDVTLGGVDGALFQIVDNNLEFRRAPDFEAPNDANNNGVYEITLNVSDENGATASQDVQITVQSVPEPVSISLTESTDVISPNASDPSKRTTDGDDVIVGREHDGLSTDDNTFDTWNLGDFVDGGDGNDTLIIAMGGFDTDLDLAEGAGVVNVEFLTTIVGSYEDLDRIELAHIPFEAVTIQGNRENDIEGTFQIDDIDGQSDVIISELRLNETIVRNSANEYDHTEGSVEVSDTVKDSDISDEGGFDLRLNHAFDNATEVTHTLNLDNLTSIFKDVESVLTAQNDPNLQDLYSMQVNINHDLNQDGVVLNETINVTDVEADFIGGNHDIIIDIDNFAKVDEDGDSATGRESDGETVLNLVANVEDSEGIGLQSSFDEANGLSSNTDTAVFNLNGLVDPDATDPDLNQVADGSGVNDDNSEDVVWSIDGVETTTFNVGVKGAEIDGYVATSFGWSTGTGNDPDGSADLRVNRVGGAEDDGNPRQFTVNDQTVTINATGRFEVNEAFDLNGAGKSSAEDVTLTVTGEGAVDLAAIETEFPSSDHDGWSEGIRAGDSWSAADSVVLNAATHSGGLQAKISGSYFDTVNLGTGDDLILNEGLTGFLSGGLINTSVIDNGGSDVYVITSSDLFGTVQANAEERFDDAVGRIQGVENLGLYLTGQAVDVSDWVANNDVYLYEQRDGAMDAQESRLVMQDDADIFVRGEIWNSDEQNSNEGSLTDPLLGYDDTNFDTPIHTVDIEGHEGGDDDNIRIHLQEDPRFTGNADFNRSAFAAQIEGVEEVLVDASGENEGPDETPDDDFDNNEYHYLKLFDVTDLGTSADEENWGLENIIVQGDKDVVIELDVLEVTNGTGSTVADFAASLRTITIDSTALVGNGNLVFNAGASGTVEEELTFGNQEDSAYGFGVRIDVTGQMTVAGGLTLEGTGGDGDDDDVLLGGIGDDVLIDGTASGDDLFFGNEGDDLIYVSRNGETDNDVVVYDYTRDGADQIVNFVVQGGAGDRDLDTDMLALIGITDAADLLSKIESISFVANGVLADKKAGFENGNVGPDIEIDFGGGNSITFVDAITKDAVDAILAQEDFEVATESGGTANGSFDQGETLTLDLTELDANDVNLIFGNSLLYSGDGFTF